jgi:flavin-dependent dehydrogenase
MLASTVTRAEASDDRWDVIVIGAGIAGSLTSLGLARRGRRVLLIERSSLPRSKVCGACLNQDAIAGLRAAGVWPAIEQLGGHSLARLNLRAGSSRATLALAGGHAVSRFAMDRVLTESAVAAGVEYLCDTAVTIDDADPAAPTRSVSDSDGVRFQASVVVAASGLACQSLSDQPQEKVLVESDSRIGLGAHWLQDSDIHSAQRRLDEGVIYMAVGRTGYVGMVLTEGGIVNLAAAVDRSAVRASSPAGVCDELLKSCGWDHRSALSQAVFRGTVALTRRRPTAGGHRLFFAGDATGYVEPFTGQGMAWAIRGGMATVPWVESAVRCWHADFPEKWTSDLRGLLGRQQRQCRWIANLLRHPALVRHVVSTLSRFPTLGQFAVDQIQSERPFSMLHHRARHGRPGTSGDAA